MPDTISIIQLAGSFVAFFLVVILFRTKPSEQQKILFAGTVCIYIDMLGYYFELTADCLGSALIGIKMEYIGNTLGTLCFLLFVCIYSNNLKYRIYKGFYIANNLLILILVLTCEYHGLYYSDIDFVLSGGRAVLTLTPGVFYYWWIISSTVLGLSVIYIAFRAFKRHKPGENSEYGWLVAAAVVPMMGWPLNLLDLMEYDVSPMTMLITSICLVVIMYRYRLFDAIAVAKNNLVEEIEEGIIVYSTKGLPGYCNREALKLFPELQRGLGRLNQKKLESFFQSHPDGFTRDGRYYRWEITNVCDGRERTVGRLIRVFDDTKSYEYTRQLIELKEEAEKANQAKSLFLAHMSHEIRTPINAILGMNEMILQENPSPAVESYANDIQKAGKTLLSIISDILDLSRVESGRMEIVKAPYDTISLFRDLQDMIRLKAAGKGLELILHISPDIPSKLMGDELRLKQAAANILTNSVKYTQKGRVTLKAWQEPLPGEGRDILLHISVSDTGIGIRKEDMGRLFTSFERLDEQENRNVEGSGLGLNITKGLIDLMEGSMEVESVYGEGSTFSFSVPQTVVQDAPIGDFDKALVRDTAPGGTEEEGYTAPEARILVVDDNQTNLVVAKGLLRRTMMQVDCVLSGKEGLELACRCRYDVILIDHMMPEMDGMETFSQLQESKASLCRGVPCIALTANALAGSREIYMAHGFSDYLAKPMSGRQLRETIRRFLPEEICS